MRRRAPDEKVTAFRRRVHAPEGHALRDRLAAWAKQVMDAMTAARPAMPPGIEDRNADVWESLLAVADGVGGQWPDRARAAAVALVKAGEEADPSLGLLLLADLKKVFDTSTVAMKYGGLATATILERLISMTENPWGDLHGKPITDRILAQKLKQYGVKPSVLHRRRMTDASSFQRQQSCLPLAGNRPFRDRHHIDRRHMAAYYLPQMRIRPCPNGGFHAPDPYCCPGIFRSNARSDSRKSQSRRSVLLPHPPASRAATRRDGQPRQGPSR
jgi:hypothetical protein